MANTGCSRGRARSVSLLRATKRCLDRNGSAQLRTGPLGLGLSPEQTTWRHSTRRLRLCQPCCFSIRVRRLYKTEVLVEQGSFFSRWGGMLLVTHSTGRRGFLTNAHPTTVAQYILRTESLRLGQKNGSLIFNRFLIAEDIL